MVKVWLKCGWSVGVCVFFFLLKCVRKFGMRVKMKNIYFDVKVSIENF